MKKLFIFGCFIFCRMFFSQEFKYFDYIKEAEDLYHQKNFKESALKYDIAYESMNQLIVQNDLYNAACAWSLAGNSDKAFLYLDHIVDNRMIQTWNDPTEFYKLLINDNDFRTLKSDKRWSVLVGKAYNRQQDYNKKINNPLADRIRLIGIKDQGLRLKLDSVRKKSGLNSVFEKELMLKIKKQDSLNLFELEDIIKNYGWLGPYEIGYKNNQYLFLVIQHADLKTQKKYLSVLREAVRNGKALPKDLAYLEDRINRRSGIPQIYGSQVYIDKIQKTYYLFPVQNVDLLDSKRASVGLEPISTYLKNSFNMDWNIAKYKEEMPLLEKELLKGN